MSDADILRQQIPTSTDPDRLEREALRAELDEAKRHIEKLTGFYMDNVLWTRAAEEARAFVNRMGSTAVAVPLTPTQLSASCDLFVGVSG